MTKLQDVNSQVSKCVKDLMSLQRDMESIMDNSNCTWNLQDMVSNAIFLNNNVFFINKQW